MDCYWRHNSPRYGRHYTSRSLISRIGFQMSPPCDGVFDENELSVWVDQDAKLRESTVRVQDRDGKDKRKPR